MFKIPNKVSEYAPNRIKSKKVTDICTDYFMDVLIGDHDSDIHPPKSKISANTKSLKKKHKRRVRVVIEDESEAELTGKGKESDLSSNEDQSEENHRTSAKNMEEDRACVPKTNQCKLT